MENKEHNLQDKRCECCGYMTYHREHMGCIRAAEQAQQAEPVARDVLMKFGEEVYDKTFWACRDGDGSINLPAIVDRYAAQPPAVAVPDENAAFNAWFDSQQGKPYEFMFDFAKAAWKARAMLAAAQKGGAA